MAKLERVVADHDIVLLDAMGVLINKRGPIADAPRFIDHLNDVGKPYFILTNISSDTEVGVYERLRRNRIGLRSPSSVISAGALVCDYLMRQVPPGASVGFIGPAVCASVLDRCGHDVVACDQDFDTLAILDDEGFAFRENLEAALTGCVRAFQKTGKLPPLLLGNSDCAYPAHSGGFAFGSGIFATMLKDALGKLLGVTPEVISFGKPSPKMFNEARRHRIDDDDW